MVINTLPFSLTSITSNCIVMLRKAVAKLPTPFAQFVGNVFLARKQVWGQTIGSTKFVEINKQSAVRHGPGYSDVMVVIKKINPYLQMVSCITATKSSTSQPVCLLCQVVAKLPTLSCPICLLINKFMGKLLDQFAEIHTKVLFGVVTN